jgi:hypothetical protein
MIRLRLIERLADELPLNASQTRELYVFPSLQSRFTETGDSLVSR